MLVTEGWREGEEVGEFRALSSPLHEETQAAQAEFREEPEARSTATRDALWGLPGAEGTLQALSAWARAARPHREVWKRPGSE